MRAMPQAQGEVLWPAAMRKVRAPAPRMRLRRVLQPHLRLRGLSAPAGEPVSLAGSRVIWLAASIFLYCASSHDCDAIRYF